MSRDRVIVLGAGGQLGQQLVAKLQASDRWEVIPCDRQRLDITDEQTVRKLIRESQPRWVVNCAALTNVDYCETHSHASDAINARPVEFLAETCDQTQSRLVQISTDFVFDGQLSRPYREEDATGPLNVYGRSKLLAEQYARICQRYLIVRTAWLFGPGKANFVSQILSRAASGSDLRVVDDQKGSPTYSADLAECLDRLMGLQAEGLFHVVNSGQASWYELACRAIELAGLDVPVIPIHGSEYASPATRPDDSSLDCTKYLALTGHQPREWSAALKACLCSSSQT